MGKNHHYVPQFYLRQFANPPKQINLYALGQQKLILGASLKGQCYRKNFYGPDQSIENALMVIENGIAPVIQRITRDRVLPAVESVEHDFILLFIAMQIARTETAGLKINEGMDRMIKKTYRNDPRLKDVDFEKSEFGYDNPVLLGLGMALTNYRLYDDLGIALLTRKEGPEIIISDNPIYRYNLYCEREQSHGVLGMQCRGLLVVFPLSPELVILLYDREVYALGTRRSGPRYDLCEDDLSMLNLMQCVFANHSIYFSSANMVPVVSQTYQSAKQYRRNSSMRVDEFFDEDNKDHRLLKQYEVMPNTNFHLSFLRVRRKWKKIHRRERGVYYRRGLPAQIASPEMANDKKRTKRFFQEEK